MANIDAATMNEVFKHLKIKKTWEEVTKMYLDWDNVYKHDQFQYLDPEELRQISSVYEFKSPIIYMQRRQFIDFLSKNKEFYNDNLDIVIDRIRGKLQELSVRYGHALPYINWYPEYGGMMQDPKIMKTREADWRKLNNIPYMLYNAPVPNVPVGQNPNMAFRNNAIPAPYPNS